MTDKDAGQRRWRDSGAALDRIGYGFEHFEVYGIELTGMSFRPPQAPNGEWLIVVRGLDDDGAPVVAFHSDVHLDTAVVGLQNRLTNRSLRWREDEYAR